MELESSVEEACASNCISLNQVKRQVLGTDKRLVAGRMVETTYDFDGYKMSELVMNMLSIRYHQGLCTVFVIGKNTSKRELSGFFDKLGRDFPDIELIDCYACTSLSSIDLTFQHNCLPHGKIDVIGDIHGLYDEFKAFIETLGYTITNFIISHRENRKILFLGDVVDKGQSSLKMLRTVYNSVNFGGHFALIGNHENKILQFKKHYDKFGHVNAGSFASSETILELLKAEEGELDKYVHFLEQLPAYYVYEDIAFVHANIEHFDPDKTVRYKLMYGSNKTEQVDITYDELYRSGLNKYVLFHGHCELFAQLQHVFSLERDQVNNGELALLPLDVFMEDRKKTSNLDAFNNCVKTHRVSFDYESHFEKFTFFRHCHDAYQQDLLKKVETQDKTLILYKTTEKITSENYDTLNPFVLKANGVVFDFAGNILINPMAKTFGFAELPDNSHYKDRRYVIRERIFGQMVNVGFNPFTSCLFYASGGFIEDNRLRGEFQKLVKLLGEKLLAYCRDNKSTLTFCFYYNDVYLITGKDNTVDAEDFSEERLDGVAKTLCNTIKRPRHETDYVESIYERVIENEEQYIGYIFRSLHNNDYLFTINTLASEYFRLLSMMTMRQKQLLFQSTDNYIQRMETTYHAFFHFVVSTSTLHHIRSLNDDGKYKLIGDYFEKLKK
jgi:hypothetical protein